jgi:hypothetical protein
MTMASRSPNQRVFEYWYLQIVLHLEAFDGHEVKASCSLRKVIPQFVFEHRDEFCKIWLILEHIHPGARGSNVWRQL